jgi:murein DD-endopeptidase MepM/ murein hydrolase activator NlpD
MWVVREIPYVNWQALVPPVDFRPLAIRQDAKGDGRYRASRSGGRVHQGIDLQAPLGSPVRAVRSGSVIHVGSHRGMGLFIEIEHSGGLKTLYAHLGSAAVETGDRVKQGHIIGTIGKTGNAKHPWIEPHVHFEVARNGQRIDPATLGLQAVVRPQAPEAINGRGGE